MIAYSRPKKVEVFYYTGDTPEWAQWQLDNNVTVKHPQVSSYVIINGGGVYYMTDKDFHEEYDVPRDVSGNPKQPYQGTFYEKASVTDVVTNKDFRLNRDSLTELYNKVHALTDEVLKACGYKYDGVCWSKLGRNIGDYKDGYFVYTGNLSKRGRQLKTYHDLVEFEYDLSCPPIYRDFKLNSQGDIEELPE
jgi:hypothetical protein